MRPRVLIVLAVVFSTGPVRAAILDDVARLKADGDYAACVDQARTALARTDPDRADEADLLDLLCHCLQRDGSDSQNELLALTERAVTLRTSLVGEQHPALGAALRNRGRILWTADRYDEARAAYDRALALQTALATPDPIELGRAHLGVANLATLQQDHPTAEANFASAQALFEEVGRVDLVASVLNSKRRLLARTDRGDEARAAVEEAVRRQRESAPTHPNLGLYLANLAALYRSEGRREDAVEAFTEALAIAQRAPQHPRLAYTHRDLGRVLMTLADYERAEAHFRAAADQLLARPDHYVSGLVALQLQGGAELAMVRFEPAAEVLGRALTLRIDHLGPDDPGVATVTTMLGQLDWEIGDYEQALVRFQEALRIRRGHYGEENQLVAQSLLNVADAEWYLGHSERALERSQEALATGKLSGDAWGLAATNVALYSLELGDTETAAGLVEQIRPIFEESYDDASVPMIALESVEGQLAQRQGDMDRALRHLARVCRLREDLLGPRHPLTGLALEDLAIAQRLAGDAAAFETALRAESITREFLHLAAGSLPDRQALRAKPQYYAGLDTALLIAVESGDPAKLRRAAEALFTSRSMVLDVVGARRQLVLRTQDRRVEAALVQLQAARRALARAALASPVDAPRLESLRRDKEARERSLAALGGSVPRPETPDLARIQAALDPGSALVAFARVTDHPASDRSERTMLALVITPHRVDAVRLGIADDIQARIATWRATLLDPMQLENPPDPRPHGVRLRQAIWDPLTPALGEARRILLVPDGQLHLVNFAALPSSTRGFLIDDGFRFHRLGAERDLLTPTPSSPAHDSILLVGDPHFQSDAPAPADGCALADLRFEPLPATAQEVAALGRIWTGPQVSLTADQAGEAAFKRQAPGHAVLHLATHGFFLGDTCGAPMPGTRGIGTVVRRSTPRTSTVDSPLLRCGLAFAGANRRGGPDAAEDGVLLAEEILNLDLSGTDWAVLSACDTGVGQVERGEGVVGLQRAFRLAGVRTLVMSLWPVQDEASRDWMLELYRARWQEGHDTMDAVHLARTRTLASRRERGESDHPFFWAAFVAAGDWR